MSDELWTVEQRQILDEIRALTRRCSYLESVFACWLEFGVPALDPHANMRARANLSQRIDALWNVELPAAPKRRTKR